MPAKQGVMMAADNNKALSGTHLRILELKRKVLRLYLQYVNPKLAKVAEAFSQPKAFFDQLLPVDIGKWLAVAAGVTGFLVWMMPDDFWAWQAVIFLAVFFLGPVAETVLKGIKSTFYNLLVSYPGKHLLDEEIKLDQAIVDGVSEMVVHGEPWKLMGKDCSVGNTVRIIAIKKDILYVVPVI